MKEKIKKLWAKIKVHLPLIGVVALVGVFVLGLFFLSRWTEKEDKKMLSASASAPDDYLSYYLPEHFSLFDPMTFEGEYNVPNEYSVSFLNEERLSSPFTCISSTVSVSTSNTNVFIRLPISDYVTLAEGPYTLSFFVPDNINNPMRSLSFYVTDLEEESSFSPALEEHCTFSNYGYGTIYCIPFYVYVASDTIALEVDMRYASNLLIYDLQLYLGNVFYCTPYPSSRAYSSERLRLKGYDAGYDLGLSEGYDHGYEEGYNGGIGDGYIVGHTEGYAEAKEDLRDEIEMEVLNDKETFLEGIFAIFDAPLRVVRDIFNFELFGINIADLVLFVLTAIIVVIVVKKLKGG